MTQKLIINVGVSGSGKSTWSTNYIKENEKTVRINRDDLRKMFVGTLQGYYHRPDVNGIETNINLLEPILASQFFFQGYSVIVDNTNLKFKYIESWFKNLKLIENKFNHRVFEIQINLFDIEDKDELQQRVYKRDGNFLGWQELKYIVEQVESFKQIKKYLIENHSDKLNIIK